MWLASLLILACAGEVPPAEPEDTALPEEVPVLSFAVIGDTHIVSGGQHLDALRARVERIGALDERPALVVVVGDVAWGPGYAAAAEALGALEVPWLPILGDNEIQAGEEAVFQERWAPAFSDLSAQVDGMYAAPIPATPPDGAAQPWLDNRTFTLGGVRFVTLDWSVRIQGTLLSETAELHDWEGGTLPWLEGVLEDSPADEPVVMLSHHPMHLGSFDLAELETLETRLAPYGDRLVADLAGHYHLDYEEHRPLWDLFITDAPWNGDTGLRLVHLGRRGEAWTVRTELLQIE
ncbi:MAG: metallophosphoesterase [Deltaproteobacteria bacterium]|nr:metallophosphoesterase [Deltaproteobacteria bacterium]